VRTRAYVWGAVVAVALTAALARLLQGRVDLAAWSAGLLLAACNAVVALALRASAVRGERARLPFTSPLGMLRVATLLCALLVLPSALGLAAGTFVVTTIMASAVLTVAEALELRARFYGASVCGEGA
jgi:hypothetical protein